MKPTRLLYLIPLLLAVAIIVFGEALAGLWKEDIKSMFQQNKWMLLAFVLLLALLGYLWERQQKQNNETPNPSIDPDRYAEAFGKFKAALLEQYQRRLRAKTAQRLPINLSAKPTRFGTSAERAALYFKDLSIESEDIASEMDKILRATDRLLLIGEPGAGKTTILLFAPPRPGWQTPENARRYLALPAQDFAGLFCAEGVICCPVGSSLPYGQETRALPPSQYGRFPTG